MIRDQETMNTLLDSVSRFVRERLVPAEEIVAETDEIPEDIVRDMKDIGLFGLTLALAQRDWRTLRRPELPAAGETRAEPAALS